MIEAEYLFSRQLMPDFLAGKSPTQWDIRDPMRIGQEIADGFRAYLRGSAEPPKDVDVDWVFNLPDTLPEGVADGLERLPDDVAIGYSLTGQRSLQYLQDLTPTRIMMGLGIRTASTNHTERARLRRAAAAVEDPIGRLASPEFLSVDGIGAIASVYPELYQAAVLSCGEVISELKRPLRAREQIALSRVSGVPARAKATLQGKDESLSGEGKTPRGKAPQEPNLKPGTQRLTER